MLKIVIDNAKRIKAETSAFISFDYDIRIVDAIRALPTRYYNPENKTWEIPVEKVSNITTQFPDIEVSIDGQVDNIPCENEITIPDNFSFKTEPFSHQIDGLKYGLQYDRWFLGDEQGLGKTKQVIDIAIARKLKYGYLHCLIVCGVNTLKWNWVNEIHTHSDEDAYILGQKTVKGKIKIGSSKDKLNDLRVMLNYPYEFPYFIITNVESFRDEGFAKTVQELCKAGIINMCAADEMHKMKNPTSQQTKGFLKCLPECRIGMTGTPLMNSPLDLYVILKWLGYESHAFYSFKNYYCVMGGYGGYEVVGYRNMEQLTNRVKEIMLRRLKIEVLDLPEKIYVDEYVEMLPKQASLYKEVDAGIRTSLAMGEIDLTNPLAALIRLRQCTGYTGIISDEIFESSKLERMVDIVDECISNNQKVIIFSNWSKMTEVIEKTLNPICQGVTITGDTKDADRQYLVDKFQNDNNVKVIVGTIGAMGTGLTLTAATTVIFMDEPWNRALYDQAVDRAHRIGQKNNITIYNVMCKDTIDERIHNIVYKKGLMSDAIIDGKIVGNKREIFDYLIG